MLFVLHLVSENSMYLYDFPSQSCKLLQVNVLERGEVSVAIHVSSWNFLMCRWFHGNLTRREARSILQDFGAGNGSFLVRTSESFHGKFAISFV